MSRLAWILTAGYVFFLPVQFDAPNARIAPSDFFVLAFAIICLSRLRIVRSAWTFFHWALAAMFLIGTAITSIRDGRLNGYVLINKDIGLLVLFLSYAVITTMATGWDQIRRILKIFILATAAHAAISTVALLMFKAFQLQTPLTDMFVYANTRAAGMLIDPNAFGGLLLTALVILAASYAGDEPIVAGWPGFLCVIALGLGLLFTLSRSAWIGFGAAAVLSLLLRPKLLGAYATAALAGGSLLLFAIGMSDLTGIMSVANRPNTAQQRLDQINSAIPMLSEHPFFGAGIGSYLQTHGGIIHDTTFWMAAEFGLFGVCVFMGLIASYFMRGFQAFRLASRAQSAVVLGLVCAHLGMFAVSFGIEAFYQRHWWLVMALIASAYATALHEAATCDENLAYGAEGVKLAGSERPLVRQPYY